MCASRFETSTELINSEASSMLTLNELAQGRKAVEMRNIVRDNDQ
jgi:hypothetical protein